VVGRVSDIANATTEEATMSRIYVTEIDAYSDDYETSAYARGSEQPRCRAGYFSESAATYWHGDKAVYDGANLADVNTRGQHTGQGLYRTAQGRWVLREWSNWQGATDIHAYIEPDEARDWLIFNDYDDDAEKHFGAVEPERGPGRPEIGNPVQIRLGDLLARVDAYAAEQGRSRADAVRELIGKGLD
jgi:hypothetical protein